MTLIVDSFNLKKPGALDERTNTVFNIVDLPTITDLDSLNNQYLYEGLTVYVLAEFADFQIQRDPNSPLTFIWKNIGTNANAQVVGAIDITTATTQLDLSLVTPAIATCHSVVVTITDGSTAQISTIINFPSDQLITFYSAVGDTVTYVHTEYDTPGNDSIVLEDSFNFDLVGRTDGNDCLTLKKHNVKLCQWSAIQFLKRSEISNLLSIFAPIDNLTSTSTTNSLSANQGRILNSLINEKANAFLLGPHLQYFNTALPYTLEALPYNFRVIANNTTLQAAINAAHTAGVDPNYFRVYYSQAEGTYILPPKVPSKGVIANTNNWLQISNGVELPEIGKYKVYADAGLSVVAGTDYYLKLDVNTIVGDSIPTSFNTDGSSTIKVNTKLPEGLYNVKAKINLVLAGAQKPKLQMFFTDVLGTNATPLDVGTAVLYDEHYESCGGADTLTLEVETLLTCTTNVQQVLVLKLVTDTDFTNYSFDTNYCGFIQINKIRSIEPTPSEFL